MYKKVFWSKVENRNLIKYSRNYFSDEISKQQLNLFDPIYFKQIESNATVWDFVDQILTKIEKWAEKLMPWKPPTTPENWFSSSNFQSNRKRDLWFWICSNRMLKYRERSLAVRVTHFTRISWIKMSFGWKKSGKILMPSSQVQKLTFF